MNYEWHRDNDLVSTDPAKLDLDMIHGFLTLSYWAKGIPRDLVKHSIDHSIPFGVYRADRQVGFARIITDYATFSYLADVFIIEEMRGQGLGVWLMECIAQHPEIQGQRMWSLFTRDAHWLYEKIGFTRADPQRTERLMVRGFPDIYQKDT